MITMLPSGCDSVPSFSCPEVLCDMDDVKTLRNAMMEMLETVLYDQDLTYCTPSDHLYIVAKVIHVLTHDIEKAVKDADSS